MQGYAYIIEVLVFWRYNPSGIIGKSQRLLMTANWSSGHMCWDSSKISHSFFGFFLILCLYLLQTHFGISSFSHPDNALEVCGLLTPLHIVPEWYFLCQYAMLKAVPNKNAGFIILLTSIFILFYFGEIRNLTTLCLLNNNGFSLSSFFSSFCSLLWLGAQFPIEKFLSYGRIFTLHYYFLLMCILFFLLKSMVNGRLEKRLNSFHRTYTRFSIKPLPLVSRWPFLCLWDSPLDSSIISRCWFHVSSNG